MKYATQLIEGRTELAIKFWSISIYSSSSQTTSASPEERVTEISVMEGRRYPCATGSEKITEYS